MKCKKCGNEVFTLVFVVDNAHNVQKKNGVVTFNSGARRSGKEASKVTAVCKKCHKVVEEDNIK